MDNRNLYNATAPRVLLIDDNPILLRVTKEMLQDRFNVSIATSSSQAFMAIDKNIPDIIFLDYKMPVVDGEAVMKKLSTDPRTENVPVIFFTSSAEPEVVTRLLALKPAGYILKPPNKEKMIELIDSTLAEMKKGKI